MGAEKNRLNETVLLSTLNICQENKCNFKLNIFCLVGSMGFEPPLEELDSSLIVFIGKPSEPADNLCIPYVTL